MALVIAFSLLFVATVVTTVTILTTRSDRSKAKDTEIRVLQLMQEETYVTDFSIDEPVIRAEDRPEAGKIFYMKIKQAEAGQGH
ncbi:MAG: hypothetical protein RL021_1209 [Bacteroidota bacterium]|jgi:hypothetical protein